MTVALYRKTVVNGTLFNSTYLLVGAVSLAPPNDPTESRGSSTTKWTAITSDYCSPQSRDKYITRRIVVSFYALLPSPLPQTIPFQNNDLFCSTICLRSQQWNGSPIVTTIDWKANRWYLVCMYEGYSSPHCLT